MKLLGILIIFTLLIFSNIRAFAQPQTIAGDTANVPYWNQMMQDPDANFYSTVSAFEKYWENRPITKGCRQMESFQYRVMYQMSILNQMETVLPPEVGLRWGLSALHPIPPGNQQDWAGSMPLHFIPRMPTLFLLAHLQEGFGRQQPAVHPGPI
jgi:hypothetical protein